MEDIINFEFFEGMSSAMKHIYFAYSVAGGALYENYTTSKLRYIFGALIAFQYASYVSMLAMVIIQQEESNIPTITNCLVRIFHIHGLVANVLSVYWKRGTFRTLFDQMSNLKDDEFVNPNFHFTAEQIDEINMQDVHIKGTGCNFIYLPAMSVFLLLQKLLTYTLTGEFTIDYQWDFQLPVPYLTSQTLTCYILVQAITFLIMLFFPIVIYGTMFLPLLLSIHLKNQAIRLQNDMKYHSDLTFECMEECDRREQNVLNESPKCERVRDFQLRDIQRRRDGHVEEFMHKVRQWIKYHQKLISCINLFERCVTLLLSPLVVLCSAGITGSGYDVAKIILDSEDSGYAHIAHVALHTVILLAACSIANVTLEMSDDISAAIYSMPWYYLPVKHQKVLLQFLTFTQNNSKVYIFKVFPLSLEEFPKLMNDAYGYIQLIRALEMKVN